MEKFLEDNLVWILTLVFAAGGVVWSVRNLGKRIDNFHTKFDQLNDNDREKDRDIGQLDTRVSVLEQQMRVLDQLTHRIDDIWKHIMRVQSDNSNNKNK